MSMTNQQKTFPRNHTFCIELAEIFTEFVELMTSLPGTK